MEKITILAERDQESLIRIEGMEKIGEHTYKTLRHEWWYDKEMMKQNIHSDGNYIYARGFAGSNDKELIELFNNA